MVILMESLKVEIGYMSFMRWVKSEHFIQIVSGLNKSREISVAVCYHNLHCMQGQSKTEKSSN